MIFFGCLNPYLSALSKDKGIIKFSTKNYDDMIMRYFENVIRLAFRVLLLTSPIPLDPLKVMAVYYFIKKSTLFRTQHFLNK